MWDKFYNVWLVKLEVTVIYLLAAVVTILGLFMVIYRNFIRAGWDVAWLTDGVYGLTYYLCLTGAIVASRKADHIAIDLLSHFVPSRFQGKLIGSGLLIASGAAAYLAYVATRYISEIVMTSANAAHIAIWRQPLVPFFILIAFHLAVQGTIRFMSTPQTDEENVGETA